MELLPIIIIVSLLGFFIILTLILFTCVYLRAREARKRRRSSDIKPHHKPTRKLTLQSGKAIPTSEAQETASMRPPHSLDLTSPMPIFTIPTYTVTCEAGDPPKSSGQRPIISAQDHGHPPILADLEAQIPPNSAEEPRRAVSEPNRPRGDSIPKRVFSIPASLTRDRNGSLTVPRPALVAIESRSSATRSSDSTPQRISGPKPGEAQPRRSSSSKGQEIADSLQKAYQGPMVPGGQTLKLATNSATWNTWAPGAESGGSSEGRPSGQSLDSPALSSRAVSDSIQKPPPLFSRPNYSPRVQFAPPTEVDYTRVSFLSMTDSLASEQMSPISPMASTLRAPPPSTVELAYYESTPPISRTSFSSRRSPTRLRNTPPHLETPDFGKISFFDWETSSDEPNPLLQRGLSGLSHHSHRSIVSNFTIASSEVSSANWTFGNAKVINIYPSVAQEKERNTPPPYAKTLRSKYGQYPRGRRNKALPVIPKSPLSRTDFGSL